MKLDPSKRLHMRADGKGGLRPEGYLCSECANDNGATWPEGHVATSREGECSICHEVKRLCCASDWDWPGYTMGPEEREI